MTNPNWKPWVFYRDSQGYWKRTTRNGCQRVQRSQAGDFS